MRKMCSSPFALVDDDEFTITVTDVAGREDSLEDQQRA